MSTPALTTFSTALQFVWDEWNGKGRKNGSQEKDEKEIREKEDRQEKDGEAQSEGLSFLDLP